MILHDLQEAEKDAAELNTERELEAMDEATEDLTPNGWLMWKLMVVALILNMCMSFYYPVPHDFKNYVEGAELLLSGQQIYGSPTRTGEIWFYGPLWAATMASIVKYLGSIHLFLKIPAILANTLMVGVVYQLLSHFNKDRLHGTLLFMFSYLTLFNTAMGNDDSVMVFLMAFSVYLLLIRQAYLSGVVYGLALGFKIVPIVILPAMLLYILKYDWKRIPIFLGASGVVMAIIILSFGVFLNQDVTHPYTTPFSNHPVALLGPMNFVRMTAALADNLILESSGKQYLYEDNPLRPMADHPLNTLVNSYRSHVLVVGYLIVAIFILISRLENKDKELLRNILLLLFTGFFFGRYFDPLYLTWVLPFILPLIEANSSIVMCLTPIPLLIYSMFYRWTPDIPLYQHLLIHATPLMVFAITFISLKSSRLSWAWMMLVFAMFQLTEAIPRPEAYAIYYYLVAGMSVLALMVWIAKIVTMEGKNGNAARI